MRHSLVAASLIAVSLALFGCGSPAADAADDEEKPALVEKIEGAENLHRITLTARAAERLGIETTEVAAAVSGRTQVPYSSILYDAKGDAWAYVVDGAPLVFVRQPITVHDIVADSRGDYAILGTGPQPGSLVVTVGVAELFGAEFEVGH